LLQVDTLALSFDVLTTVSELAAALLTSVSQRHLFELHCFFVTGAIGLRVYKALKLASSHFEVELKQSWSGWVT
jgi:hypothetical protein